MTRLVPLVTVVQCLVLLKHYPFCRKVATINGVDRVDRT